MKEIKQNIKTVIEGRSMKLQFNFCSECKYFKSCYEDNANHPSYISPECFDISEELGYE